MLRVEKPKKAQNKAGFAFGEGDWIQADILDENADTKTFLAYVHRVTGRNSVRVTNVHGQTTDVHIDKIFPSDRPVKEFSSHFPHNHLGLTVNPRYDIA